MTRHHPYRVTIENTETGETVEAKLPEQLAVDVCYTAGVGHTDRQRVTAGPTLPAGTVHRHEAHAAELEAQRYRHLAASAALLARVPGEDPHAWHVATRDYRALARGAETRAERLHAQADRTDTARGVR